MTIPKPIRVERGAGGEESLAEAAKALAGAKFPVIVAGGGVIMSDGQAEAVRLAEHLSAPVVTSYLHNDAFPASHPLMCGPLGYQGSKAAMKIIAEADVVLALGTRLGPFGTLPQHGIDYWPKNAKIIQVDSDHRMLGLVKQISVGVCGDAKAGGRGDPDPAGDHERGHRLPRQQGRAPGRGEEAEGCLGGRAQPMGPGRGLARSGRAARCASWRRPCRRTPWSRPTSAISARSPTAICASRRRAASSPP